MNIVLLYISPNGTTQTTANSLSETILKYGHQVTTINIGKNPYRDDPSKILPLLRTADVVGFGSAAYHMDLMSPMVRLFSIILAGAPAYHFRTFFFMNYSGITTGKAFLLYARQFQSRGLSVCGAVKIIAPHFHHKMAFPTPETAQIIQAFIDALEQRQYRAMTPNEVQEKFQPYTGKVHFIYPLIHLIGKRRELPITIDSSLCKACGKCARECPAGAIHQNTQVQIDFQKCLHCYHCVAACPQKAVLCPVQKLDKMMQTNIKIIGMEQPGNQFYV